MTYWSLFVTFAPFWSHSTLNNIVVLKSRLRVTRGHWKLHHLIDHIRVLAFRSNYGTILYRLWDIGRNFIPTCILTPPAAGWWPCRNFTNMFDTHKTRMTVVKKLRRCVPPIPERDGQTDRIAIISVAHKASMAYDAKLFYKRRTANHCRPTVVR